MFKNTLKVVLVFFLCTLQTVEAQKALEKFQKVKELAGIEEYLYTPNGLKVLLLQDNSSPVVTVQVVYGVGSTDEVSGTTGATHLLEHLMFKGTEKYNKRKGNAIFSTLQNVGARMNATTWYDRTNYYETIPSSEIELALDIESDRMRNSLLLKEDKDSEMTVVRNEFERGMNNPSSLLQSQIWSMAYLASPYHHSTIGWRSDIENVPMEKLREFYDTYYWPNNATLTVVGDFENPEIFRKIDKYFGKIPRSSHEIPEPYTTEPEQLGSRDLVVRQPGQVGIITKGYKIPGKLDEDYAALEVLSQLLASGPSSVLNKRFVDTGIALGAGSSPSAFKKVGLFTLNLRLPADADHEQVDLSLEKVVDSIKGIEFKQEDINRIISKVSAQNILYRDGSGVISSMLNEAIASGDWTNYINEIDKLKEVTSEDVQRVAREYLVDDQSTTGYFIPKEVGSNPAAANQSQSFTAYSDSGKLYFRDPSVKNIAESPVILKKADDHSVTAGKESKMARETVENIDVISLKTSAEGFVTVTGSMSLGDYSQTGKNELIPDLTAWMLSKGTQKKDKVEFSKELEELGVYLNVYATDNHLNFNFRCLKKDIPKVLDLFAEELRYPLFDAEEFKTLKNQNKGSIGQEKTEPGRQAQLNFLKKIYKADHPNYPSGTEERLQLLEEASLEEVREFHKKYFGTNSMRLVFVGDVEEEQIYDALASSFDDWTGGVDEKQSGKKPAEVTEIKNSVTELVYIPEKTSAELLIGQYTGLSHTDDAYIPFYLANSALGSGFSGRLMMTVRDEEGLTYGIGSNHGGDNFTDGYWSVSGSFSPDLIEKGLSSSLREIRKWYAEGITAKELENIKSYRIGSYKVGLSTTQGLAGSILRFVNEGRLPEYIYEYPEDLAKPSLKEVNAAIKKYLNPDSLVIIKAGTLEAAPSIESVP